MPMQYMCQNNPEKSPKGCGIHMRRDQRDQMGAYYEEKPKKSYEPGLIQRMSQALLKGESLDQQQSRHSLISAASQG